MIWLLGYAALLNLYTWVMMGRDKHLARHQKRRIPEKRLWLLAWLGGSAGMLAGMFAFRHKTRHLLFRIGVPMLLAAQVVFILFLTYG
ncbi:DUF1294 domain-containing protein [Salibacterium sp. K-3]